MHQDFSLQFPLCFAKFSTLRVSVFDKLTDIVDYEGNREMAMQLSFEGKEVIEILVTTTG